MFLMPSRYEPCGLNQIYSLRYGTVPIVRATGGLDDTVQNFDPRTKQGTGFKFEEYNGQALLESRPHGSSRPTVIRTPGERADQRHGEGFFLEGFGRIVCHVV